MKRIKKVVSLNELIHWFANDISRDARTKNNKYNYRNSYEIKDNKLYMNGNIIAIRLENIVIIKKDFGIRNTGFGRTLTTWDLEHAFNEEKYKIIYLDKISYNTEDNWEKELEKENLDKLINSVLNEINAIDYTTNSKVQRIIGSLEKLIELQKQLKITIENLKHQSNIDYINNRKIYQQYTVVNYSGWNRSVERFIKIEGTIQDVINYKIKDEEKYRKKVERIEEKEKNYQIEQERKKQERLKKDKEECDRKKPLWLAGENVSLPYIEDEKTMLRLLNGRVNTSKGATVTLVNGQRLYNIFKDVIKSDEEKQFDDKNIIIDGFKLWYITKDEQGEWFIKIGCHTLYQSEIDAFVERNNLNW